jgi:ATP-dependent DNA ligase
MASDLKQLQPAACSGKVAPEKVYAGEIPDTWWAEEKTDDLRYLLHIGLKTRDGTNAITSRRISKQTNEFVEKTSWVPQLRDYPFPSSLAGTIIDGGFFDPKNPRALSGDVTKAMRKGAAKYRAFDILFYKGQDVRKLCQNKRRVLLRDVFKHFDCPLVEVTAKIKPEAIKSFLKSTLSTGGEGIILKDPAAPYGKGWKKVKRKSTYDVFIIGYADPVSEIYAAKGWIGSLQIAQLLKGKVKPLGQVKNMTDELRAKISANQKKFLGRVVEISAETRMNSGLFRNPSVVQIKIDKNKEDCLFRPKHEA